MIHKSRPKPTAGTTKSQIRRAAVLGAFTVFCVWGIVGLCYGKSFSQAVSNSAAATLGGLGGWTVYHLVSRRNDGLSFLAMNMFPISSSRNIPFWPAVVISLVIFLPLGWLIGLTTRGIKSGGRVSRSSELLYDADIDGL